MSVPKWLYYLLRIGLGAELSSQALKIKISVTLSLGFRSTRGIDFEPYFKAEPLMGFFYRG